MSLWLRELSEKILASSSNRGEGSSIPFNKSFQECDGTARDWSARRAGCRGIVPCFSKVWNNEFLERNKKEERTDLKDIWKMGEEDTKMTMNGLSFTRISFSNDELEITESIIIHPSTKICKNNRLRMIRSLERIWVLPDTYVEAGRGISGNTFNSFHFFNWASLILICSCRSFRFSSRFFSFSSFFLLLLEFLNRLKCSEFHDFFGGGFLLLSCSASILFFSRTISWNTSWKKRIFRFELPIYRQEGEDNTSTFIRCLADVSKYFILFLSANACAGRSC